MTSSLVGSEMCIRDSVLGGLSELDGPRSDLVTVWMVSSDEGPDADEFAVSYTHLTLPTICSV
eukprot:1547558-Prorocentrum_lima.AAC.1